MKACSGPQATLSPLLIHFVHSRVTPVSVAFTSQDGLKTEGASRSCLTPAQVPFRSWTCVRCTTEQVKWHRQEDISFLTDTKPVDWIHAAV
ncbi:hypothetical protein scyTo_0008816 [Scyliorhinus torazame]|uniref:Uncharacterized protein n=1 Tax=Scyliorhinus torazame TaxID=75743 RepID=A0A401PDX6_SCYTO|nr:hypothetical protein [Scyliorhinus torazame]